VGEETAKTKGWPKAANALSGRLRRAMPDLGKAGITVRIEDVGHEKVRTIFLSYSPAPDKGNKSSTASPAPDFDRDFNGFDAGDDAADVDNGRSQPSAPTAGAVDADSHRPQPFAASSPANNPLKNNGSGGAGDAVDDFAPLPEAPEHACQQCTAADGEVLKYRSDGRSGSRHKGVRGDEAP
jgi:hypothetical protein